MLSFLNFVVERHRIWELRQLEIPQPWTQDAILASKKFTCVFRVLDPGTQFLFTDLYPDADPWDQLLRAFLYRHTGRIETWKLLLVELGEYPTTSNLDDVLEVWLDYRLPFFTNAYLVYPQSSEPGTNKVVSIVSLAKRVFGTPGFLDDWYSAKTSAARFKVLRSFNGVGDFMSMQVLTDWNYTQLEDYESDWVQPGPGAIKGLKATGYATVKQAWEDVLALPSCPTLDTPNGPRKPSLMDCQNLLCEFSKYFRYSQRNTVYSPYVPAHPGEQPDPIFPSYY